MTKNKFYDALQNEPTPKDCYENGLKALNGKTIERFEWARDAAIYGVEDAIQEVVAAYQMGHGVEPNARMAFEWLKKAADAKMEWAYYDLAKAYGDGTGTRVDVELFREWMAKASEVDNGIDGMMELAKSYREVRFGTPDSKKAFEWIRKMAAAGGAGAMIELSQAYAVGARVTLDIDQQLYWANQAVIAAKQARENEDYASQDLPFALSAHANALKAKGNHAEAATQLVAASEAAYEASNAISKETGDIALSNDLLEIILRNQKGRKEVSAETENFKSLSQIKEVAVGVYASKDDCPVEISDAIVELAKAYQKGIGTKASPKMYKECMGVAKNFRNHHAMCSLALKSKNREDLQAAAAAGSMEAFARVEFDECKISAKRVTALIKDIMTLQEKVYGHREKHHKLDDNSDVAHYTDSNALESMLGTVTGEPRNVMRMYNIAYLNDPGEGRRLFDVISDNPLRSLEANKADTAADEHSVYIGAFSLVSDRLNLWRAYTNHGNGFSIVTPSSAFEKDFSVPQMAAAWSSELKPAQRFTLFKVLYEDTEAVEAVNALRTTLESLERKVKTLTSDQKTVVHRIARMVVSELLYLYKSEEYSSEKEVRFVTALRLDSEYVRRDKTSPSAKLYAETRPFFFVSPGSKIIIGPTVDARTSVAMALRQNLCDRGWDGACKVEDSEVKYQKSSSQIS